jgi:hypothetical protein
MKKRTKRRLRRLAIIAIGIPVAAWALEEAARRSEARSGPSPTSRRLRTGADWLGRMGRGPLASRLRRPPEPAARPDGRRP